VPPALAARWSAVDAPARADDELTLAALMDLFEPEELEETTTTSPTAAAAIAVLRSSAHGLRTWTHHRLRSAQVNVRLGGPRRVW
jgi:hypothetical protein